MSTLDGVVSHPRIGQLGATAAEQDRVARFARDLAHWLHGAPADDLGPLARVIVAVLGRELRDVRALCRGRPLLAVEAAARAVESLWPLLRWDELVSEAAIGADDEAEPEAGTGADGEAEPESESESEDGHGSSPASPEEEGPADGQAQAEQPAAPATSEGSDGDEEGDEDPEDAGSPAVPSGAEKGTEEDETDDAELPGDGLDDILAALAAVPMIEDPELDGLARRLSHQISQDGGADDFRGVAEAATDGALATDRLARQLERFVPGLGWSTAPGQLESTLLTRLNELSALLERLHELRDLADRLGRLEEASRREGLLEGGREEVVGVRLGGDFANALPSDLGLLADSDTEDLFYQRFLERRLVTLELEGTGDEGVAAGERRGPVIACIDTSASMAGAPELAAKALVLALCRRVVPQGRLMHLILFGGPGERTEIRIRRGLGGLEGLIDFLNLSFHSGTDFDGPLLRATDLLEEQELRAADVLVITDGLCRANQRVIDRVEEVRHSLGARVWSVVLGRRDVHGVEPFSDEVHQVDPSRDGEGLRLLHAFTRS